MTTTREARCNDHAAPSEISYYEAFEIHATLEYE